VTARAGGSALVVVLVLLSGLGALALAAAAAALTALALAGHQQMAQNAFEAAETGIVNALVVATRADGSGSGTVLPDEPTARAEWRTETREAAGPGSLPEGFSVGEGGESFAARHFFVTSDASSGRGARVRLEQGFYIVVPAS
jgi:hypothetical protein